MKNKFHQSLQELFHNKLSRASALLFLGGLGSGVLGYVFQVLLGRMLSAKEYALLSAMMALFVILSVPLGTLVMVVSRKVSYYRSKNDGGSINHLYRFINIRSIVLGILFALVFVLLSEKTMIYLKVHDTFPVLLLGLLLFFSIFHYINSAFLQGFQYFKWMSVSNVLLVVFKIVFACTLVWLGFGLTGAIGGIVISTLMISLITYGALFNSLKSGRNKPFKSTHLLVNASMPVFIANAAFAIMTQFDMVLVNYYFQAEDASLYAVASLLGKAVMFLPGGIALALFPMVAESHAQDKKSSHLLYQAISLTIFLCGAGALFYFVFAEGIISLFYGGKYQGAADILKYFGFAILPMAIIMVAEHYLIAKGMVIFAYLFIAIAPLQILAIHFYHDSLLSIVSVIAIFGVLLVCLGFGLLWHSQRKVTY